MEPQKDPVATLERWERFGAYWRVTDQCGDVVTVSLCRCDGGEEFDQITSAEPLLIAWLAGRRSSTDPQTGQRA